VRCGDIVTHIDGVPIANDGSVSFRAGGGRIHFTYLLSQCFAGDTLKLRILRDGKPHPQLAITLRVQSLLVPESSSHRKLGQRCTDLRLPSYYIAGGLVFVPLCEPYLRAEYGEDFDAKAPVKLLEKWQHGVAEVAGAQVVLLSQVFAHVHTVGYEHHANQIVTKVNGERVLSLADLVARCEAAQAHPSRTPFLTFELEPHQELVVLESIGLRATTDEFLDNHQIPHDRSADLRVVGSGGSGAAASSSAEAAPSQEPLAGRAGRRRAK